MIRVLGVTSQFRNQQAEKLNGSRIHLELKTSAPLLNEHLKGESRVDDLIIMDWS